MLELSSVYRAVEILRRGGLVAFPTETVYGLGADAENELAVRQVFAVKGRPSAHPLIVHLGTPDRLDAWVRDVPRPARVLARTFWPGPLTLVLPRSARASDAVTGGQETVAVRVPDHPVAIELLKAFGGGLAAPSANRFGRVSPTTAAHVRSDLGGDVELVLDGGPCQVGVESTIVDLSSGVPRLLRPGGVPKEALERTLGEPLAIASGDDVRAPGLLPSHYAPKAGVRLATRSNVDERVRALLEEGRAKVAVLGPVGTIAPPGAKLFLLPEDPAGQARALYGELRQIDTEGFDVIVAVLPPETGLGLAVRDRLTRAAH